MSATALVGVTEVFGGGAAATTVADGDAADSRRDLSLSSVEDEQGSAKTIQMTR